MAKKTKKLTPERRQAKRALWFAAHNKEILDYWRAPRQRDHNLFTFNVFSEGTDLGDAYALSSAFQAFDLDPSHPINWRYLLGMLAFAVFGKIPPKAKWQSPRRGRGRSAHTVQRDARLQQTLEVLEAIFAKQGMSPSKKAIARAIRDHDPQYKTISQGHLERLVLKLSRNRAAK
jgi:hypothetical protein